MLPDMGRARRQDGTVEPRGSKWYGHYYVYIRQEDGSEVRRHKGVDLGPRSKRRKWEAEDELRRVILKETGIAPRADDSITLQWFIENRFLPMMQGGWSPSTTKTNNTDMRCYIVPALGACELSKVDTFKCQQFLYDLNKRGLSEPVITRSKVLLHGILELAVDMELLPKNPARKLKMPNCVVRRKPVMPKEELRILLNAITDTRDHLIMMIGIFCAVRPEELFGLKWSSYEDDKLLIRNVAWEGKLYEGKTKTKKARAPIYIPAVIQFEIEAWKKLCKDTSPDALMFPTAKCTPLTSRNFRRDCIKPVVARLNAKAAKDAIERGDKPKPLIASPLTFQVWRRSAATRNQKHGTMKDVQTLLRHSKIGTTGDYYMQEIDGSVREMMESDVADVLGIREVTQTKQ